MNRVNFTRLIASFTCVFLISPTFAAESSTINDTVITTKIKAKLALDKTISMFDIGVNTNDGIVKLSGTLNSSSEEKAIIQLAQSTTGVTKVNASELTVKKSDHPFKDTVITAEIKGLYLKERLFGKEKVPVTRISVETNNGIVYLTGKVANTQELDSAINIAKSVSGVKSVVSRIEITVETKT